MAVMYDELHLASSFTGLTDCVVPENSGRMCGWALT